MPLRALRTSWEEDRSAESDEAQHGKQSQALVLRLERHNFAEHRVSSLQVMSCRTGVLTP
jgi:hypothetical protein